jgi:hypothetical protein
MPFKRRTVLCLLGTGVAGSLSGCQSIDTNEPRATVTISIGNLTLEERTIQLTVVPAIIETDLSEEMLLERHVTLGPAGSSRNSATLTDAFDAQKALVRVELPPIGVIDQYTYIPDCVGPNDPESEIRITLDSIESASFDQNYCHTG